MNKPILKITDFGIAGIWRPDHVEETDAGTLLCMPPELISKTHTIANPEFDVWALGIIMFYLLFGYYPFNADSWEDLKQKILNNDWAPEEESDPENGHYVSACCLNLLRKILEPDYTKWASIVKIISHSWFETDDAELEEQIKLKKEKYREKKEQEKLEL